MAETRGNLRQLLCESIGDWWESTLSSTGGAAGATLIDVKLQDHIYGGDNDGFLSWWFVLAGGPTGAGTYEQRRAARTSGYTASTGTVTPSRVFSAQITNGVTYEMHRWNPDDLHNALLRGINEAYQDAPRPRLYLPVTDETIVVDDLLSNSDFETFAATFTGWTHAAGTWTQEATRVWHGSGSAKGVAAGVAAQLTQNIFATATTSFNEIASKTLHIRTRVWASAASTARIRVTFDGSTYTNGSYHAGTSDWEGYGTQYIDVTIPDTATQMTVMCEVAAGGTAYFDSMCAYIGPIYRYARPSSILDGPTYITVEGDTKQKNPPYYKLDAYSGPLAGHRLRVEGLAPLTQFSDETTAAVEVDRPYYELLVAYAARWLVRQGIMPVAKMERDVEIFNLQMWEDRIQKLRAMPGLGAEKPNGVWHLGRDGATRRILFDVLR